MFFVSEKVVFYPLKWIGYNDIDVHLQVLFRDSTFKKLLFDIGHIFFVTGTADVLGNLWYFQPSYCGPGEGPKCGK